MTSGEPITLTDLHEAQRRAIESIAVGSVIHDGIAISRVTGEATVGKHPAWKTATHTPTSN